MRIRTAINLLLAAQAFLALLSIDHPFAGLQALAAFLAWACVERFGVGTVLPRRWALLPLLFAAHLLYYLVYLPLVLKSQ